MSSFNFISVANIFLVVPILLSLFVFYKYNEDWNRENIQSVIDGLIKAEKSATVNDGLRVAVGLGSCIDVITPAISTLEELGLTSPAIDEISKDIQDLESFLKVFTYYFKYGAAAELYTKNKELMDTLVKAALKNPQTIKRIGGNAPVMVKNFFKMGYKVLLGAQTTEEFRKELPSDVKVVGQNVSEDDIHLVFEYNKGQIWGKYQTPRANRFIIHNDHNNPFLTSLETFEAHLQDFKPNLVVIGGLQMMDNFPFQKGERRERLERLGKMLASLSEKTHVHFEMAHFSEKECLEDILETIAAYCDSFGMNEQELPNLLGMLMNDSITQVSEPVPRIAVTLDKMRVLFKLLRQHSTFKNGSSLSLPKGKISRLHVHTLAFQAIMTSSGSEWKNSFQAAAKASLTAHRHTCGSHYVDVDRSKLLMDDSFAITTAEGGARVQVNPEEPVTCWTEEEFQVCLAPVVVCTQVTQTAGGGDTISSSTLALQL